MKERHFFLTFIIVSAFILFFIIAPIVLLYLTTNYRLVKYCLMLKEVRDALMVTFTAASVATLLLLLWGVPLAYTLARRDFKGKELVEAIIDLPLAIPHVIVGILILITFSSEHSPIGAMLRGLGITIEDSFWGIVLAMMYVSAPLLVDTVKEGIKSIDPMLESISRSLGADIKTTFLRVTLPLSARYIISGALLAWARAVSEVGALLIIAYYPKTINILIIEWFHAYGVEYTKALTLILLSACLAAFVLVRLWRRLP